MLRHLVLLSVAIGSCSLSAADPQAAISFQTSGDALQISIGGQAIGEYVLKDEQIRRPHFKHLRTLAGTLVTRNSPPQAGDLDDHPTMHPGLWLAFGDLSGADFWRNKGVVKHGGFVKGPLSGTGSGSFTVRNVYHAENAAICTEECSVTISARSDGYLLDWVSVFHSDEQDFTFGDQEEMGLGVRVASPLSVVRGGEITDSQGRKNGKEVWGQQADWCQYGGVVEGRSIGVVLMPDPRNFRRSWFHARDYGLVVANPFGQRAFTKGEKSSVVVSKGKSLRLRFGVLVYDTPADTPPRIGSAYQAFVETKP
jgi:hypothetical protein